MRLCLVVGCVGFILKKIKYFQGRSQELEMGGAKLLGEGYEAA